MSKSIRIVIASVLLLAGIGFVVARSRVALANAESDARVYFYDQSERRLYAASKDTLPPDRGTGGEDGDGVRAVVVAPRDDHRETRIAYFETYSAELKQRLIAVQESRRSGATALKPPSGDDPFVLKNTMVRRPSEATWYDLTTAQAREILREWQSWKDDAGRPLVITTP